MADFLTVYFSTESYPPSIALHDSAAEALQTMIDTITVDAESGEQRFDGNEETLVAYQIKDGRCEAIGHVSLDGQIVALDPEYNGDCILMDENMQTEDDCTTHEHEFLANRITYTFEDGASQPFAMGGTITDLAAAAIYARQHGLRLIGHVYGEHDDHFIHDFGANPDGKANVASWREYLRGL